STKLSKKSPPRKSITAATRFIDLPESLINLIKVNKSAGGKLSIVKKPKSSKLWIATVLPAPDMPVIMINSVSSVCLSITWNHLFGRRLNVFIDQLEFGRIMESSILHAFLAYGKLQVCPVAFRHWQEIQTINRMPFKQPFSCFFIRGAGD